MVNLPVKLSVTDGAQWLSLQTELHTRPVSFLVSGEALETNSRAAPLSTFRLSRARFELLVSKYRAGGRNSVLCGYRAPEIDLYRCEAMLRESAARPLTEHHREGTSARLKMCILSDETYFADLAQGMR